MHNFFAHQDKARSNTLKLIMLMFLAVLSLVVVSVIGTNIVIAFMQVDDYTSGLAPSPAASIFDLRFDPAVTGMITAVVVGGIALFSGFKLLQLRGGGSAVAEALGGFRVERGTRNPDEQKVLNIVEEISLAANMPMPAVYMTEDLSINAFAAGHSIDNAAVCVTQGCATLLTREQLQGVIAHEFSHIANGDMRLNINLVSILHGILFIGLAGEIIMRMSGSDRKNGMPILLLGAGLIILGYAGTFFGRIIQAAVSRQREFLADASAVQFTRNPSGIAGALKTIREHSLGSNFTSPKASQFNHMFFDHTTKFSLAGLFSTHPPLDERIGRLEATQSTKQKRKTQ